MNPPLADLTSVDEKKSESPFPLMANPVTSPSSSSPIDPGGASPSVLADRGNTSLTRSLEMKLQSPMLPTSIPAARVPSYAARFKASLRNLRKISNPSFLADGTPVVQAPESVLWKTSELWKDHVVAHFHGRRPSAEKIVADLNPVWGKFGRITVRTVSDTCVLIFIPSVQTREWVLQVGYWQADRCDFSVYPWTADGNLAAQELIFAPRWVILKNVLPQLYSLDGISVVASGVGEPLHTEKSRLDPFHFGDTKVKVEVDLSKSLPEVVEVRDTQGNAVRVDIEYPSLPPKCINCGRFGHLLNRCHKPLMRRSMPKKKEKLEKVISVVKSSEEMLLVEKSETALSENRESDLSENREVDAKAQNVKARSRSRRRSRSRARARARALSSPPEVDNGGGAIIIPEAQIPVGQILEKGSGEAVGSVGSGVEREVSGSDIAEEGEIVEAAQSGSDKGKEISEEVADGSAEVEPVWFTKNSKKYRRAIRQMELWKSMVEVGSPPKSAKYLTPRSSSGKSN